MKWVSISEFARLAKVSRQAIHKLTVSGQLPSKKGKLDLDDETCKAYLERRSEPVAVQAVAKKSSKPSSRPAKRSGKKAQATAKQSKQDDPPPQEQANKPEPLPPGHDRASLDRAKIALHIQKLDHENRIRRGEFIPLVDVKRTMSQLHAIDTAQWQQLGTKIAPEILGILGISDFESEVKVRRHIDDHVFKVLQHVQKVMSTWISSQVDEEELNAQKQP